MNPCLRGESAECAAARAVGRGVGTWFVSLYLDELDHRLKETRGVPGYVRYTEHDRTQ